MVKIQYFGQYVRCRLADLDMEFDQGEIKDLDRDIADKVLKYQGFVEIQEFQQKKKKSKEDLGNG